MIAGTMFAAVAMLKGQHWQLMPAEKNQIAQAMSDCIGAMPDKGARQVAEMAQTFAAPLALFGALGTAIGGRVILEQQHLANERAKAQRAAAQRAPAPTPQETPAHVPRTQPQSQPVPADPYAGDRVGIAQPLFSVATDGGTPHPG